MRYRWGNPDSLPLTMLLAWRTSVPVHNSHMPYLRWHQGLMTMYQCCNSHTWRLLCWMTMYRQDKLNKHWRNWLQPTKMYRQHTQCRDRAPRRPQPRTKCPQHTPYRKGCQRQMTMIQRHSLYNWLIEQMNTFPLHRANKRQNLQQLSKCQPDSQHNPFH